MKAKFRLESSVHELSLITIIKQQNLRVWSGDEPQDCDHRNVGL